MPKAVHDCVDKVKGEQGEDSAWAICNAQISEVATALGIVGVGVQEEVPIDIAKALPDPDDMSSHTGDATTSHDIHEEVPIDIAKVLPDPDKMRAHPEDATTSHNIKEHHNPLDIPFGYELNEINKNVKDPEIEEGGLGSGRNPEGGDSTGGQPGPLISFGETLMKEIVDSKLSCPCNKKK